MQYLCNHNNDNYKDYFDQTEPVASESKLNVA